MNSKIINMAEKIKDAEDRFLESLFESEPVADNGFSSAVMKKINRQLWLRRLTLPCAAVIGGIIAFKPLAGLVTALANFWTLVPDDILSGAAASIPQVQTILLGAILLVAGLLGARLLED